MAGHEEIPKELEELKQKELPGFDELTRSAKKRVKLFDPRAFGMIKARTRHVCHKCSGVIEPGETYYREGYPEGKDRFLGSLHGRKLCRHCYEKLLPPGESSAAG